MIEETEILTVEITSINRGYVDIPKPGNEAIAKVISQALTKGDFSHDDVVVTKVQSFEIEEVN